jgi:hypothetical protein
MTVSPATKQELTALLKRIANPKSVKIKPDLSDSNYKYRIQDDETYKSEKRQYVSSGQLN